jgi:hypothetical protein
MLDESGDYMVIDGMRPRPLAFEGPMADLKAQGMAGLERKSIGMNCSASCGICSTSQSDRLAGPFQAESFAGNRAVAESDTEPKLAPLGLRTTLAAKMRQHFLREQLHTRGNLGRIGARPLDGIASDGVTHNPSPGGQQCDGVCAGPASASSRAFFAHRHDSKSIGVAARPQLKT